MRNKIKIGLIVVGWVYTSFLATKWMDVAIGWAIEKYNIIAWRMGLSGVAQGWVWIGVFFVAAIVPPCVMGIMWFLVARRLGVFR